MRPENYLTTSTGVIAALLIMFSSLGATAQITSRKERKTDGRQHTKPDTRKDQASFKQRFEKEGIAVEFEVKPTGTHADKSSELVPGSDAVATFRVTDTRTHQPITGLHPTAWINARRTAHQPNELECKDMVGTLMGGLLSTRAEINLNGYIVATLNHDNTITFINPQVSFSSTKLENIISLPGRGSDWTLTKDNSVLYVSLPGESMVGVIDTITRKLITTISTGEKTKPMRVALQPDGRYVWVGLDESPFIAVIETATNKPVARIPVGAGLHNLAFTSDSRFVYVSNSAAGTVSAIDTRSLKKIADISAGETPVPVAYSETSRLIYVAAINGHELTVIDPITRSVVKRIPVSRGIVALKFAPDGRFAFAVNQVESTVSVIDAATNTLIGSSPVVKDPDQVNFTQKYAYIRGLDSEKFSLIDLNDAAAGKPSPVNIQAGRQAASTSPNDISVANMIVPTPEGNAVMIANAPDQMLYYYVEGMMAPMGTFSNYKRRARALLVLDHSLAETAPGVYSVPIKISRAGVFDVPVVIDQPRMLKCFQLTVNELPGGDRTAGNASIDIKFLPGTPNIIPLRPTSFQLKITDSVTKQPITGLDDVLLLAFEPPGVWQQRQWAREIGKGVYEVSQDFPHAGLYSLMVGVSSRGVNIGDLDPLKVAVSEAAEPSQKNVRLREELKNEHTN